MYHGSHLSGNGPGKKISSRSGKSQGIPVQVRENLNYF